MEAVQPERPVAATRPRNRKQLILDAAGRAFNDRGFHAASMEAIATEVGITATALYRHFPNKYALFARCANLMADRLVETLDHLPPGATLDDVFRAIAAVTVDHRESGGSYRWEARYLEQDDRRALRAKFAQVVGRVGDLVDQEHPMPDAALRAAASLGAIGSITTHHVPIARRRAIDLLVHAAHRVAATDPTSPVTPAYGVRLPPHPEPRTRRSEILQAAIPLFHRDGYASVTMGRIAETIGLAPSTLYRHYPGKADILAAACLRAAAMLEQAVTQALAGIEEPAEALVALASTYVAYSFENTELTGVAEAEVVGLPPAIRRPVILAEREHVALWEQQVRACRPDLGEHQARALVHAGLGVVAEAGRRLRWEDTPARRGAVTALMVSSFQR